ncbi:MAG: M3 family oligoendopeptidase [Lachnospiraceae bacterium]|nr:M3 family oligoendopeptidase [Lachnospiraceae bacterium]
MKFSQMPYERADFDKLREELVKLTEEMKNAKSGKEAFEINQKVTKAFEHAHTMSTICHIRHDIDTADKFYETEQEYYDEMWPTMNEVNVEYKKALFNCPYRDYLVEKLGPVTFKNMELEMRSFTPEMVPLMQEENALRTEYSKLIASAKIDWEGEELNLSLMTKYTTDKDREVRKKAYAKTTGFLLSIQDKLDDIYDKLVKNRTAQAKLLGHDTYTALGYDRMGRNDYGPEEVKVFRDEVKKKIVPLATKINERRRERLGLDHLYYYDPVSFKDGDPRPTGTPEEILAAGQKMYAELSPETKEFFDFMTENELFDVLGRKTKRAGGYMTSLPEYDYAPFIFANFNGTQHDVEVITHEAGHAFQGYVTRKNYPELNEIGMETAEIHSMSMEFFTEPWMKDFFGDKSDDYVLSHLEGAITFIPYGCMVDEFQHIVYENPDLTPKQRRNVWLKLEKEYRPDMDFADNEFYGNGGWWQRQNHIFGMPFYYIDYCLAQTVALEYKAWMDEDYKAAWESYLKLCKLSASDFYSKMLPQAGLRVPFEKGCLDKTVEVISKKLGF